MKMWRSFGSAAPADTSWRATPSPQSTTYDTSLTRITCADAELTFRGRGPPPVPRRTRRVFGFWARTGAGQAATPARTVADPMRKTRRFISTLLVADLHRGRFRGRRRARPREGDRLPAHGDRVPRAPHLHDVPRAGGGLGKVPTVMGAPTLLALERAGDDQPGRGRLVAEIQPVLPGEVQRRAARHADVVQAHRDPLHLAQRRPETLRLAHQPGLLPHHRPQITLELIELGAGRPPERSDERARDLPEARHRQRGGRTVGHERGHGVPGDASEDGGVGDAIAAQPIGAVHAPGVLAGGEEPFDGGAAAGIDDDAAHHEVGRGPDLHGLAGQVAAEVAAALDHAPEVALDHSGPEAGDVDPHPAARRAPSRL